jgi:hypothetical protein
MVGPQQIPFGEFALLFICQKHSFFILIISTSVLLFLELRLVFNFRLDMHSNLVISFHQGVFFASGLYWFSSKEVFIKSLNGVEKEKKL